MELAAAREAEAAAKRLQQQVDQLRKRLHTAEKRHGAVVEDQGTAEQTIKSLRDELKRAKKEMGLSLEANGVLEQQVRAGPAWVGG
jgi:hypothetical protein